VEEIPAKDIDSIEISSTKIRNALLAGDIKTANNYLGHSFCVTGRVVDGKKIGREIGYPTANIFVEDKYKLIPADGVYAVKVRHDNSMYGGMLNIGNNPTVGGKHKTIEVNIFDFDKDIYEENATIFFIERLRDEVKFNGLQELKDQLAVDKINSLKILGTK
jgi:riboflavin kinase/FMN adenylyltransferase